MSLKALGPEEKLGKPFCIEINFEMQKKIVLNIILTLMFVSVKPNPVNYFQPGVGQN